MGNHTEACMAPLLSATHFADFQALGVLLFFYVGYDSWIMSPRAPYIDVHFSQVWFIIGESVASACYGVALHVGERLNPKDVCGSFETMYQIFFKYLNLPDQQKHFRFAYVWNEVPFSLVLVLVAAILY